MLSGTARQGMKPSSEGPVVRGCGTAPSEFNHVSMNLRARGGFQNDDQKFEGVRGKPTGMHGFLGVQKEREKMVGTS